jgi:hypothetical protein
LLVFRTRRTVGNFDFNLEDNFLNSGSQNT